MAVIAIRQMRMMRQEFSTVTFSQMRDSTSRPASTSATMFSAGTSS